MKDLHVENMTGINTSGAHPNEPLQRLTATSMIGDDIFNPEGETLGKIKDIMINLEEGKIEYIVIEFGGFLGLNEKYFAVPLQSLTIAKEHKHSFILHESKESLKNFPGFDKDHWPDTNRHKSNTSSSSYGSFMGANTGAEY